MRKKSFSSPLKLLTRPDKWYLGGGNRLLWAPEFPLFLDQPGFWDHACYYNYAFEPLFTWTLLNAEGREIGLRSAGREWNPAKLTQKFAATAKIEIREEKSILPNDVALSVVRVKNKSGKKIRVHVVAWTAVHASDLSIGRSVFFTRNLTAEERPDIPMACAFGVNRPLKSVAACESEGTTIHPRWSLTPFAEKFRKGSLGTTNRFNLVKSRSVVFVALHCVLPIGGGKEESVAIAHAVAPSPAEAAQNLKLVLKQKQPVRLSIMSWEDHFSGVPAFSCSDEFLTRYYWYRWYGLRLNTMYGNEGNYSYPFVCEGIGYFRAPISYSAPGHMLESRWMHEPELAQGSLLTFLDNQREDGGLRGYIDVNHVRQEMFYHANWGRAVLELDRIHPSVGFLESAYKGLKAYAEYFDRERDEEISGMYDIDNHYETGQEYMHRYVTVNPEADETHWGEVFRLKGVDVTVYLYELKQALATIAERLGKNDEADLWIMEAEKVKSALLTSMWDPKAQMFFDVDPATGKRTGVKAATCFYPYFTDIANDAHRAGLQRHLFDPKEFWTTWPVPSSSADDPYFSAEPEWKGIRRNCPWNGRVWPMTNSHVAEALATTAIRSGDAVLKRRTVEFIRKFIRMMFFEQDPKRPNCFEHYNPLSGEPSAYRGIDDYQHSWVNDLIIKYVCGIRPDFHSVTIDPFPFGLEEARIDNVMVHGRSLKVEIHKKRFVVWLDGKQHIESVVGTPVAVQI